MKNLKGKILVLCAAFSFSLPGGAAFAADAWSVAAQALGVFAAYRSSLAEMLKIGNNAAFQIEGRRHDLAINGRNLNRNDTALVDKIMTQLKDHGQYALKANSLPFMWGVNNNKMFNAACYPTNYISVNRGLLRGLRGDENEIAAVLAHEMTHGLLQHSAKNYAKAVAQYYGMAFLNMSLGSMDWNKLNELAGYSVATNVIAPAEEEADAGGFYLMTSAGFNPGGAPAAMARMRRYLRYETEDFLEYDSPDRLSQKEYSDHPETELREQKLLKLMTEYGAGHVTVTEGKNVMIDGSKLFSVTDMNAYDFYGDKTRDAYCAAGGLSKAFHDFDSAAEWNFRLKDGKMDFLTDDVAYKEIKYFISHNGLGETLRNLVERAYLNEQYTMARVNMKNNEAARLAAVEKLRREEKEADKKLIAQMRINSDIYSDCGFYENASYTVNRAMNGLEQEDMAENFSVRFCKNIYLKSDLKNACRKTVETVKFQPRFSKNRFDAFQSVPEGLLPLSGKRKVILPFVMS